MLPENNDHLRRPQFDYVRQFVGARIGMVLKDDKEYFVKLRMSMVAAEYGFPSLARLVESLQTEEAWGVLHTATAERMAVTETSFFRDLHPFEEIRLNILPRLMERRAHTRSLNIWCASVASGQEPYSLAMLIREHFPELANWRVRIIATDFSKAMLARCRAGLYSQIEVNRGLPIAYLLKYFTREGASWRIRDDLRTMLELKELNLIQTWPTLPTMDLVLMRNVLLYFTPEVSREVLRRASEVIREDGCLLLGSSECAQPTDTAFEARQVGRTLVHYPRARRAA